MSPKPVVIKFFAPVVDISINALMNTIDQRLKQGVTNFTLLISSPGGNYYLKGVKNA